MRPLGPLSRRDLIQALSDVQLAPTPAGFGSPRHRANWGHWLAATGRAEAVQASCSGRASKLAYISVQPPAHKRTFRGLLAMTPWESWRPAPFWCQAGWLVEPWTKLRTDDRLALTFAPPAWNDSYSGPGVARFARPKSPPSGSMWPQWPGGPSLAGDKNKPSHAPDRPDRPHQCHRRLSQSQ